MKKVHLGVIIAGAAVGLAALILTALGNPTNMGFCIACFLRDISGAVGLHSAAKVQYVRPEIIGLVLGAFIMSVASKEFKARAGLFARDPLCARRVRRHRRAGVPRCPLQHGAAPRRR